MNEGGEFCQADSAALALVRSGWQACDRSSAPEIIRIDTLTSIQGVGMSCRSVNKSLLKLHSAAELHLLLSAPLMLLTLEHLAAVRSAARQARSAPKSVEGRHGFLLC
jgi:hypothetical protein